LFAHTTFTSNIPLIVYLQVNMILIYYTGIQHNIYMYHIGTWVHYNTTRSIGSEERLEKDSCEMDYSSYVLVITKM